MAERIFTLEAGKARAAGALYLAIIALGIGAELGLRGALIGPDEATTTQAVQAAPGLLRLSVAADMGMALADVAVGVLLFAILRRVDETLTLMALALRLVQAAVIGANALTLTGIEQALAQGAPVLPLFEAHGMGYDLGLVFFGANGLLMAWLMIRAGAPRLLGWGLGAAGLVYLAGSFSRILAPGLNAAMQPAYLVPLVVELGFALWLLTRRGL